MAVQRRTIWLDDRVWETIGARAKDHGVSPSRVIAAVFQMAEEIKGGPQKNIALGVPGGTSPLAELADIFGPRGQADRDAILKKMNAKKNFTAKGKA